MSFRAPVRDLSFTLTEVAGIGRLPEAPDAGTIEAVLQGAADLYCPRGKRYSTHGSSATWAALSAPALAKRVSSASPGGPP